MGQKAELSDAEVESKLQSLVSLIPDVCARLPSMKPDIVARLLSEQKGIAERLLALKQIFPSAGTHSLLHYDRKSMGLFISHETSDSINVQTVEKCS